MKSVLVRLEEYVDHATGAEKGVINFILKNPEIVVKCTLRELSEKTFCSPSTIIRLCRKIGFQGYKDFHKSLIYEIAIMESTTAEKRNDISREDSLEEIVEKVTYKNISSLEKTKKLVDIETLEQCVNLINNCKTISLFGMGSSYLVAKDAYLKFLRINKPCIINEDWHAQLLQARNISKDDLAIAISYSGLTEEVLKCMETVKKKGAPIIAITRFEDTPLSRLADYTLSVAATEFIFRSGAMSSRISQLNIIDILYTAYIHRNYDSSVTQFHKTHIDKPSGDFTDETNLDNEEG